MKRVLLGIVFLCLGTAVAVAQRTISGRVTDDQGESLVGVTVVAVGTSAGAATDIDGKYRLNVPSSATTLKFAYTGYEAQEVALGASDIVDVVMTTSANTLQDVVVVGYGTQQKRAITGSISTVKGDEIAQLPAQSFDQLLQGRAAGVNINIPNGVLNNPPVFRVRGINSINLSSFPLIVIDGVPTYTGDQGNGIAANNPLSNLNPNDIESIDILKDASATAIYGSRASAGVVLITTKRGAKGRTKVGYDAWAGWADATRLPELLNAQQYVEVKNEAAKNANTGGGAPQYFLDSLNGQLIDTRWYDYVYRTGFSQNHNLNFNGGGDQTTYYLSLGYTNQEGMIIDNDFRRLSGRLSLDHRVGKHLKFGGILGYSNNLNTAPNTGSIPGTSFNTSGLGRIPLVLAPIVSPYNADGTYNIANNQLGRGKNLQQTGFVNPVPLLDLNNFSSEADQIQGTVYGQVDLFKGLSFKSQFGIDNLAVENISFQSPVHGDGFSNAGLSQNTITRFERWNWQNILTYDIGLDNDLHKIGLLAGNEQQLTKAEGWGAVRTAIADPFFTTYQGNYTTINPAGNFQGENYLLSYFGRATYEFNRRYYLTANLRQDEYSAFAPGNQAGTFWGVSAGWTLSEEEFFKASLGNVFSFFKFRGSYGTVGNNLGIGDFASQSLFGSGLYGAAPTIGFTQAGNSALSWETSTKTDAGIVFGLFNDRIQGEYTYFKNDIDGLILSAPQAPSKGIPGNSVSINIGSMVNTGHEFSLSATVLRSGKFSWTSSANLTLQANEVTALAEGNSDIFGSTGGLEVANIIRVGESIGSLYAVPTDGVNPETGQRIYVKRDGTRVQYNHAGGATRWTTLDGQPASAASVAADGVVYGPTLPKWYGGWDNTFRYGNIDLNVQVNYAGGNYIYNGTQAGLRDQRFWNNHTDVLDRWTENNRGGSIPRVVFGDNISNGSAFPISENVEKGDFLRIRNVTLGYRLPTSLLERARISSLRIYGNLNNAFLFTNYSGTDPEVSTNGNSNSAPGVDRNSVGMARTYTVGVNVQF